MKKNNVFLLGLLVIMLAMGLVLTGCDDGSDDSGIDSRLILDSGWAWTDYFEYGEGGSDGYVFRSDGTYLSINNNDGSWKSDGNGTYSTSGGTITIYYGVFSESAPYSISGDTLSINGEEWLKKTQVGTIQ